VQVARVGDQWVGENSELRVSVEPAAGAISVEDKSAHFVWTQPEGRRAAFRGVKEVPGGVSFDAYTMTLKLTLPERGADLRIEADMTDRAVQRSRFSDGSEGVVSFRDSAYEAQMGRKPHVLPKNGFAVKGPKIEQSMEVVGGKLVTSVSAGGISVHGRGVAGCESIEAPGKENSSMSVKLTTREKGGITIIDVNGKLTLGEGTGALRAKIRELADGGSKRIVLNMADVAYMDSSGLGELIGAHTTVVTAGGEIKLLNLAKRVHDLMKLTKLYTVFESFEDEGAAVDSFSVTKGD